MTSPPVGQTLRYWLATTMRQAREDAGVTMSEIAGTLKVSESTVSRFEKALSWPYQIDSYLAAYAEFVDVDDAREFYEKALRRWRKEGERPTLVAETASGRVRAAAARASQRTKQSRDERSKGPAATPKKRGAA